MSYVRGPPIKRFLLDWNMCIQNSCNLIQLKDWNSIPLKKNKCDLSQLKDRDFIPLNEKVGILSRICTAILLSETLFSLPVTFPISFSGRESEWLSLSLYLVCCYLGLGSSPFLWNHNWDIVFETSDPRQHNLVQEEARVLAAHCSYDDKSCARYGRNTLSYHIIHILSGQWYYLR